MSIYRVRQFYWSVFAKLTESDKVFIDENLNINEKALFYKLSKSEQKHCIRVAYLIKKEFKENLITIEAEEMLKLGLLHDIGKIYCKLNYIEKSIIVILDKVSRGKLKKFTKYKKINVYYNHGELGSTILEKLDCNSNFFNIVKYHHDLNFKSKDMEFFRKIDDKC